MKMGYGKRSGLSLAERILRDPEYKPEDGHYETLAGQLKSCQPDTDVYITIQSAMERAKIFRSKRGSLPDSSFLYRLK